MRVIDRHGPQQPPAQFAQVMHAARRKANVGRPGLCTAALLALALQAAAQTAAPADAGDGPAQPLLRWSGFATLGATHHDNATLGIINSFAQRSPADDGLSLRLDSVAGVQLDLRLLASTSATLQVVSRAGDDFRPKARMAYLRQQLGDDAALRIGRIRSPLYLDSDVSEIGFAYLPVRAALPVYGVAANYVPHIDGADLQWRRSLGSVGVMVQAFAGRSDGRQIFYNTSPRDEADFKLRGIRGVAINIGLADVNLRASRTWVDRFSIRSPQIDALSAGLLQLSGALQGLASDPRLPAQLAAGLNAQAQAAAGFANPFDTRPVYTSLGVDANLGPWRVVAEQVGFHTPNAMVGRYRGWQITAGYAWQAFTPYAGVSRNRRLGGSLDTSALAATGMDPALDAAIAQTRGGLDAAAAFTDLSTASQTLGLRWDLRDNLAIKLQYDRLRTPSASSPGVFAVKRLPIEPRTHLVSGTLNLVF